jgi:hypothetical protein
MASLISQCRMDCFELIFVDSQLGTLGDQPSQYVRFSHAEMLFR